MMFDSSARTMFVTSVAMQLVNMSSGVGLAGAAVPYVDHVAKQLQESIGNFERISVCTAGTT
jgi:hypothetical protein